MSTKYKSHLLSLAIPRDEEEQATYALSKLADAITEGGWLLTEIDDRIEGLFIEHINHTQHGECSDRSDPISHRGYHVLLAALEGYYGSQPVKDALEQDAVDSARWQGVLQEVTS